MSDFALLAVALVGVVIRSQAEAPQALWEKLATFGALGLISGWLLLERYLVGAKERAARHALANAITKNTLATELFVEKLGGRLEDLTDAIWRFNTAGKPVDPGEMRKRLSP